MPVCEEPIQLNANIRVMHGHETIATNEGKSFEDCATEFEHWIDAQSE